MSHTTAIQHEFEHFYCHHNGDFSGDIAFVMNPERVETRTYVDVGERTRVTIPFEVLKELVAAYLRRELVGKYEDIDADALFEELLR